MPYDNQGNPRSGHSRMSFANNTGGGKMAGGQAKEKPATGAGGGEKPGGEMHMHAHSHKGGEHDVSEQPISDVVNEHGPATHMFTEHDHEEDSHHVHSVHGKMHHHSDHESAGAAHDHMGEAMGVGTEDAGAEPAEDGMSPDQEGGSEGGSSGHPWMS